MAVGQPFVDLLDAVHREDIAGRLLRELVRAVARADRDGQRVDARVLDELLGLVRVGEQLIVREGSSVAPWPSSCSPPPVSSEPRQPNSPSTRDALLVG